MRLRAMLSLLFLCAMAARAADSPPASYAADFVQTRSLPGFDTAITSRGNLSYDKARGFHWEITFPYHYLFEMNAGKAREELPDGSQRALDPAQTPWLAAVQHIFVSALSGDQAELAAYFQVAVKPAGEGRQVTLSPKPGAIANAISRIEVTESGPGRPEHLEIFETSGGHMDIRFTPRAAAAP